MFINRKSSKRFLMYFVDGERSEGGQRRLLPLQNTKGILQKIMPKVDAEGGGGGVGEVNQKKSGPVGWKIVLNWLRIMVKK